MKERELFEKAIQALESLVESHGYTSYISDEEKEAEGEVMFARSTITAIKEALMSLQDGAQPEQEKQFAKVFAQLKSNEEPCSEVLALGQMMKDWLQHQVSDNGSCVDTGKGFSEYDLWVMCEGKELFITIKEKRPTK